MVKVKLTALLIKSLKTLLDCEADKKLGLDGAALLA